MERGRAMKSQDELWRMLLAMDGAGYPAYKRLKGEYALGQFSLFVDHVQSDPFAPPSKMRLAVDRRTAGFPDDLLDSHCKVVAASDFLARIFWQEAHRYGAGEHGPGSGRVSIDRCGQEILERTSVLIDAHRVEARFEVSLPAAGRRILGRAAADVLIEVLPRMAQRALLFANIDRKALESQVALVVDQEHVRAWLRDEGLVAFVANGAVLPRESGVSDRPMREGVRFCSPESLERTVDLPSGGQLVGMGIAEGITLIVGGGYHGKSTLLRALERGVYNHVAGDGREFVITCADAVKIRSEDGRSVVGVDISPFINNLPGGKDTGHFSTENASGSTSQAANVMEALEAGTSVLLIDEDTSATNFMIRDERMRQLVAQEKEPITPFVDRVRALYDEEGVSTVLIVGGSGDYFGVADRVIMMDEYCPKDVTQQAKRIAETHAGTTERATGARVICSRPRVPLPSGWPHDGREARIRAKGDDLILYGHQEVDLSGLEQLVDAAQARCIAVMMEYYREHFLDGRTTLAEAVKLMYERVAKHGLHAISPYTGHPGNLALPRLQEFCAAVNRYRLLRIG